MGNSQEFAASATAAWFVPESEPDDTKEEEEVPMDGLA